MDGRREGDAIANDGCSGQTAQSRRFGHSGDPDHVGRIMHRLGLRERTRQRRQVPEVVYAQFLPEVTSGAA